MHRESIGKNLKRHKQLTLNTPSPFKKLIDKNRGSVIAWKLEPERMNQKF